MRNIAVIVDGIEYKGELLSKHPEDIYHRVQVESVEVRTGAIWTGTSVGFFGKDRCVGKDRLQSDPLHRHRVEDALAAALWDVATIVDGTFTIGAQSFRVELNRANSVRVTSDGRKISKGTWNGQKYHWEELSVALIEGSKDGLTSKINETLREGLRIHKVLVDAGVQS